MNLYSSVSKVTGYRLDQDLIPGRCWNISLHHYFHTGSGATPFYYAGGTGSSFPGGVVTGSRSQPPHCHVVPRFRMHGAVSPLVHVCSWHDA